MTPNEKHHALTAIKDVGVIKGHKAWLFRCICGTEKVIRVSAVLSGNTRGCGCLVGGKLKHGLGYSNLYNIWYNMMQRCYDPKHKSYKNYGGRGITVCLDWHSLEKFVEDLQEKPVGRSLDRKDNSKGYSPDNCKWSTPKEQQLNTRLTKLHTHEGITDSISGWARRVGMSQSYLSKRLGNGVPFVDAINITKK